MAFSNLGNFSLDTGSSIRVWITLNNGADLGAQWIQPNSIGPATLQVGDFAKERRPNPDGKTFGVLYWATITNIGDFPAVFNLTGGGNV